jgi:hypothetical protein
MQKCNGVNTVGEAIAALQAVQAEHGNLLLQSNRGGPYAIDVTIWTEEQRRRSGYSVEELRNGVTIEEVAGDRLAVSHQVAEDKEARVTTGPVGFSQRERLEVIHQNLSMQIEGGQALYDLLNFESDDDGHEHSPGLSYVWENIFDKLQASCDDLESCFREMQREGAA